MQAITLSLERGRIPIADDLVMIVGPNSQHNGAQRHKYSHSDWLHIELYEEKVEKEKLYRLPRCDQKRKKLLIRTLN